MATFKVPYFRRSMADRTQSFRLFIQISFLLLNVYLGTQFFFFVRQFERYEPSTITRPPGVEGWLPIAGLMNLKAFLLRAKFHQSILRRCSWSPVFCSVPGC